MGSEGIQITIPTLDDDDDDYRSTPVPFGRPNNFGAFGQGRDSPTMTPLALPERADRPYFHSREDSGQSFESDRSFQYAALTNGKTFASAHSSQSSLVSASIPKKSSFASLRNAFKSSTKGDRIDNNVPPVPPLDAQSLPSLGHPFSRSQSSLAYPAPPPNRRRPSVNASPPFSSSRPIPRGNHSVSGSSVFHNSDADSGFGSPRMESPPPVPKMPFTRNRAPSSAALVEPMENVPSEPRTPAEYALHAVFTRFVTAAEQKIEAFLKQCKEREPPLPSVLGPEIDPAFDELLESFSKIAQKHAQALITSILRWRKSVGANAIKQQFVYEAPSHSRSLSRTPDVPAAERERRSMAAIYVMCRALIVILKSVPKDALGQSLGNILEETTFEPFRRPNLKLLSTSSNHRANAELFGQLLGHVANLRFESVTDRFISELKPILEGSIPKDADLRFEVLIKGARYLQIRVWPPESFEEGADFLERFARCFENAHGQRLKLAFAETLVQLLHPIGKTAQAEVNHPVWAKAIDAIHSKAREMASKPRYWLTAYPLVVSSLCVAPHEFFLKNWTPCLEIGLSRLKERSQRVCGLAGAVRLIWTYLFRCREPATTVSMKLEPIMKSFFPANRGTILPTEEPISCLVLLVHFALMRQFEFGVELITFLIQEKAIKDLTVKQQANPEVLYPDRMMIAIKSILLTLTAMEKDQRAPAWPSSAGYTGYDQLEPDYTSSAEMLPETFYANRPAVLEFYNQFSHVIYWITRLAGQTAGSMSIIDERWTPAGLSDMFEDPTAIIVHRLPDGVVAYPRNLFSWVELLQVCYSSWPRCLDRTSQPSDSVDMMIRGVIHVEPTVSEAAGDALIRFAVDLPSTLVVVARLTHFLFSPRSVAREGTGTRLTLDCGKLVTLWVSACEKLANFSKEARGTNGGLDGSEDEALFDEIQAGALILLSAEGVASRTLGLKVLKSMEEVAIWESPNIPHLSTFIAQPNLWSDHVLRYTTSLEPGLFGRLKVGLQELSAHQFICETSEEESLWAPLRPALFRAILDLYPRVAVLFRDCVQSAVLRFHSAMSALAEISGKGPLATPIRSNSQPRESRDLTEFRGSIAQWSIWIQTLCITALPTDAKGIASKGHGRIPSDLSTSKDRISSARGLFRHLIPFLSSDHLVFREAAVAALGSIDRSSFQCLLEDLQAVTRHVYDARAIRSRRQDRLYTSVVEIFRRTSPFLKDFRSNPDTGSLQLVLQFVRESQSFLSTPDARVDYELQPLRRHFCGIVINLFAGLATFKDSDRFISPNTKLKLFRLCEEWCLLGQQSGNAERQQFEMRSAVSRLYKDTRNKEQAVQAFEVECNALSKVAAMALCSLCVGAFYSPSLDSPTNEILLPLDVTSVLDRINAMLSSPDNMIVDSARSALHGLIVHPVEHRELYHRVIQRCILTPCSNKARIRCFEVVSDVLLFKDGKHHFTVAQAILLSLLNLTHSRVGCRRKSLSILQDISHNGQGLKGLATFEAAVESQAANVVLHARHQLSKIIAAEHQDQTASILEQVVTLLVWKSDCKPIDVHNAVRNTLQFLEPWLSHVEIADGSTRATDAGLSIMRSLTTLTAHFIPDFPDHIQGLWTSLANDRRPMNSMSIISFLMEQSSRRGDANFASCAAGIIACLSKTPSARRIVEDLCSFIEPQDMVPVVRSQENGQTVEDGQWERELGFLNMDRAPINLAPAQLAWTLLSDVALDRAWELVYQLPSILHALFIHLGHPTPFLREQSRKMLFQTLRAWLPGLDARPSQGSGVSYGKETLDSLTRSADDLFWDDEDPEAISMEKTSTLVSHVLHLLEPMVPSLRQDWGELALDWGTSCPVRAVASKSLKIFRVLSPAIDKPIVASLIGRLSNTIADEDSNIQSFGAELIVTMQAVAISPDLPSSLLPVLFWSAASCLLTSIECEFLAALEFLDCLLDELDLDDLSVVDALLAHKPNAWIGPEFSLQDLLLPGLRSSRTSARTISVICRLAAIEPPDLLDPAGTRIRDLYTIAVVLFLHSMDQGAPSEEYAKFANDIAKLADVAGLSGISRILVSFSRNRFRTKDDFSRQGIASLKDQFAGQHWNSVVILLLSMALNEQRWMREKAMMVLKVFFQHRGIKHPNEPLSAELLMPLLRLLQTDLAPQALEVLDVHMPMSNDEGLAAKDVLRMSMHDLARMPAPSTNAHVFGIPSESGWSVGDIMTTRTICRQNAINVFESCRTTVRPSMIQFQPDVQDYSSSLETDPSEPQSLGDLVSTLHDINSFFQTSHEQSTELTSPTFTDAEHRAADILGRSLNRSALDVNALAEYDSTAALPTPFMGAFNISHSNGTGETTPHSFTFAGSSSGSDQEEDDEQFTFEKFVSKSSRVRSPTKLLRRAW